MCASMRWCVSQGWVRLDLRVEVPPILGSGTHFLLLPSNFWLVCPSTWAWWGCFYYPVSQSAPPSTYFPYSLFCLFPKRLAFLGATSEAALEGRPAGSWVASCAQAPRGGDNVLLIDWASWAECRNLQEGETEKWGWAESDGGAGHSHRRRRFGDLCLRFISVWFTSLLGRWERWWCEDEAVGAKFVFTKLLH